MIKLFPFSFSYIIVLYSSCLFLLLNCFDNSIFQYSLEKVYLDSKDYSGIIYSISDNFLLSSNIKPDVNYGLPVINSSNTFHAKGLLSTVLFPNYTYPNQNISTSFLLNSSTKYHSFGTSLLYDVPKLISGTWNLIVKNGHVTDFHCSFKLLDSDGIEKHYVEIVNFQNRNSSVTFNPFSTTVIKGYADIKIDDKLFESMSPLEINLFKINTIIINMENKNMNEIFFNNEIRGILDSFKNFKDDELLVFNN